MHHVASHHPFVCPCSQVAEEGHALAPSFDHRVGDPVPEDISITPDHKCVAASHESYESCESKSMRVSAVFTRWHAQVDQQHVQVVVTVSISISWIRLFP